MLGADENGLPVGDPQHPDRDIVVWMDHRAMRQAERINAGRHAVLRFVGGTISPEMQMPKLLWLKEQRPEIYHSADHFFDLSDFLTWKASGAPCAPLRPKPLARGDGRHLPGFHRLAARCPVALATGLWLRQTWPVTLIFV